MTTQSDSTLHAPIAPIPDPEIYRADAAKTTPWLRLFRNACLVDVAAGVIRPGQDVLVSEGRVREVGPGLEPPSDVVNLGGRFLTPGLINLHAHPGMMVGLHMDPDGQTPDRVSHDLQVWVRHGVTAVQAMGTDRQFTFDIQRQQREGRLLEARLFSVGSGFGVPGGYPPLSMDPPGPVRETDSSGIAKHLENLRRCGASGVKLWYDDSYHRLPKMTPEVARTIIEISRDLGLTSYAHAYRVDDARLLVGFGLDVLAHMPRDREADQWFVDLLLAHNTAVLPTITVPETNVAFVDRPGWVDDPLLEQFLPSGSRAYLRDERFLDTIRTKPEYAELRMDLERCKRNTALLYQAGVRMGFGSDAGVSNRVIGFSEHRELELLVEAGVRVADALRMATRSSAEILGRGTDLGEIAAGRQADFVVLRNNPLEDITSTRSIDSVWLNGIQVAGPLGGVSA